MSRRGAENAAARIELVEVGALGRSVVMTARQLLARGLSSAEVCSLFASAAAELARKDDGLERSEFLALCEELHDQGQLEDESALTSPGGVA